MNAAMHAYCISQTPLRQAVLVATAHGCGGVCQVLGPATCLDPKAHAR